MLSIPLHVDYGKEREGNMVVGGKPGLNDMTMTLSGFLFENIQSLAGHWVNELHLRSPVIESTSIVPISVHR